MLQAMKRLHEVQNIPQSKEGKTKDHEVECHGAVVQFGTATKRYTIRRLQLKSEIEPYLIDAALIITLNKVTSKKDQHQALANSKLQDSRG